MARHQALQWATSYITLYLYTFMYFGYISAMPNLLLKDLQLLFITRLLSVQIIIIMITLCQYG